MISKLKSTRTTFKNMQELPATGAWSISHHAAKNQVCIVEFIIIFTRIQALEKRYLGIENLRNIPILFSWLPFP